MYTVITRQDKTYRFLRKLPKCAMLIIFIIVSWLRVAPVASLARNEILVIFNLWRFSSLNYPIAYIHTFARE